MSRKRWDEGITLSRLRENIALIQANGRVRIPPHICRKYNLTKGDIVFIKEDGGELRIIPAQIVSRKGNLRLNGDSHAVENAPMEAAVQEDLK